MRPASTRQHIRDEQAKRLRRNFGDGIAGGDRTWMPPVYAAHEDGRPITISYHRKKDQVLVCDGHVDFDTFYARSPKKKSTGHDHLTDGQFQRPGTDRGAHSE